MAPLPSLIKKTKFYLIHTVAGICSLVRTCSVLPRTLVAGSDISEEEHEVTLRAERPVVNKETVPVERVRLGTETVTEDHEVSETLRKEQIDDPDVNTTR